MELLKPNFDKMLKEKDIAGLHLCLSNSDYNLRINGLNAIRELAKSGNGSSASIPLLNNLLWDPDKEIRRNAARAIGNLAEKSRIGSSSSIPLLNELINDQNPDVRKSASYAISYLADMGIGDVSSLQPLNNHLFDAESGVRKNATFSIIYLAEKVAIGNNDSIPLLNKMAIDPDMIVRSNIGLAIGRLAENLKIGDSSSLSTLNLLLEDKDNIVRKNAASAIWRLALLKIGDISSVAPLNKLLNDSDKKIRQNAAYAIGILSENLGIFDPSSIPILNRLLADPESKVRDIATIAHQKISALHQQMEQNTYFRILSESVSLVVPEYMDPGANSEIIVEFQNKTNRVITNIVISFSEMEEDFYIDGTAMVKTLSPGKALKQRVKVQPIFDEGTFPIKITITGSGVTIEKEYTIKVGGTEIY